MLHEPHFLLNWTSFFLYLILVIEESGALSTEGALVNLLILGVSSHLHLYFWVPATLPLVLLPLLHS